MCPTVSARQSTRSGEPSGGSSAMGGWTMENHPQKMALNDETNLIWLVVWWFGCHEFGIFPEKLGCCHHPNDFHIFQRGGPTTNQWFKICESSWAMSQKTDTVWYQVWDPSFFELPGAPPCKIHWFETWCVLQTWTVNGEPPLLTSDLDLGSTLRQVLKAVFWGAVRPDSQVMIVSASKMRVWGRRAPGPHGDFFRWNTKIDHFRPFYGRFCRVPIGSQILMNFGNFEKFPNRLNQALLHDLPGPHFVTS